MLDKIDVGFEAGVDWMMGAPIIIIAIVAESCVVGGMALEASHSVSVAIAIVLGVMAMATAVYTVIGRLITGRWDGGWREID